MPAIDRVKAHRMLEEWFDRCKAPARVFLEEAIDAGSDGVGAIVVLVDEAGGMSYMLLSETDDDGNNPSEAELREAATGLLAEAMQRIMFEESDGGEITVLDDGSGAS